MRRRDARMMSLLLFGLAVLALVFSIYVALVYSGRLDAGAEWIAAMAFVTWNSIFLMALAVSFFGILFLYFAPVTTMQKHEIACAQCGQSYTIDDPGTRPLMTQCPHCGQTNEIAGEAQPSQEMEVVDAEPETPGIQPMFVEHEVGGETKRFLVLHCPACDTNFETLFTDTWPLITKCDNCGTKGILRSMPENA